MLASSSALPMRPVCASVSVTPGIRLVWGSALPAGRTLSNMLNELVLAPEVYKKLVGMQMLVEGLAMPREEDEFVFESWRDGRGGLREFVGVVR